MTLAEERAAIRDGISASRASTSDRSNTSLSGRQASRTAIQSGRKSTSEQDRRNLGASLERQRRGTTLKQDLNSLETTSRGSQTLATREATGGRPETSGRGTWDPNTPVAGGGGGGIASPLEEKTKIEGGLIVPDRPTHDEFSIPTTDGLFTFVVKPIQTLKFTDANGFDSEFNLAPPSAPVPP